MNHLHCLFAVFVALLLLVPAAGADWADDFDSYVLGSGLHGQGGWEGWEGDPTWDAYVTDVFSQSAPHSVDITPTSDIVQQFSETSGQWAMTASNYIPSGSTGDQYFILLNTYGAGIHNWSLDMLFDSSAGMVSTVEGPGTTPIINDQWVEVRVEINLDADTQDIYYNGILLDSLPWAGEGGVTEIAALDLYSNGGSSIYWDDCSLSAAPTPVESTTWGQIKASFR
ncbi:MAG: hypothetical protein KAY24_05345 [Candidatus Eisenbacteria sp.]|nr:hypothetical protein [Candidatus Eisenbacteria bacterium]